MTEPGLGREKLTTTTEAAAVAVAVAADAGGDGGRSAGAAVSETRDVAPAKYEGEEVPPETWAKVCVVFCFLWARCWPGIGSLGQDRIPGSSTRYIQKPCEGKAYLQA